MKMKKFFYFAMSAVIASAMTSCGEEEEVLGPASLKAEVSEVTLSAEGETKTFELKATRDWTAEIIGTDVAGIEVSPLSGKASNDPVTITVKAAKNEGKNRTATIKFTASATLTAIVTVSQDGSLGNLKSIADVLALSSGIEAETEGVVVGTYNRGFVIMDETGYLLVFGKDYTEPGVDLYSKVKVIGTTSVYGDLAQLTPATVTPLETGVSVAEPTWLDVTKDNIADLDLTKCQPIKMTGILSISGNYHNLAIDGTTVQGSISYPLASLGLADLAGHNITVYGYFAGGNNAKFRNIMVVKVTDNGAAETKMSTIAEVIAADESSLVKTQGTVMARHQRGYIIGDNTGAIYVYTGTTAPTVQIGNNIVISGTTTKSFGSIEIISASIENNDGATAIPTYPAPEDLTTLDKFNAFAPDLENIVPTYVRCKAVMQSSGYYLKIADAEHDIQFSHCDDSYTELADIEVTFEGYIYAFHSTNNYWQVIPVSVESGPYLRAEKTEITIPATQTEANFKILSNVSWEVSIEADYAEPSIMYTSSAVGTQDLHIRIDDGPNTGEARHYTIKVTSVEIPGYTLELKLTQAAPLSEGVKTADINFVGWEFPVADGDSWTQSYAEHIVETDICTIQLNKWDKQAAGQTIDDCPVTKGAGDPPLVLKMKGNAKIVSVSVLLKQWGTKAQKASIFSSTDGGSTFASTAEAESSTFSLDNVTMPDGTNAFKMTLSSTSAQIGLQKITVNYTE